MTDIDTEEVRTTTRQTIYLLAKVELELEEGAPVARAALIRMLQEQISADLGPGESFYAAAHGVATSAYRMVTATVEPIDKSKAKWLEDVPKGVRYGRG
jgi:hypothetical protein